MADQASRSSFHSRLDMVWGGHKLGGMESHEWNERTEEGKRFFRANFHGNTWRIMTTLQTDPDWEILENPSEEIWRELREVVWKKYQRKRCPWERVASIDKILGDEVPE